MSDKILPSVCETVDPLLLAQSNADYWSDKYDKKYEECEALKKEHNAILKERDEKLREVHRSFKAIMENNPDLTSGTQWAQKRNDAFVAIRMLEELLASSNDDRGGK